jgi:hypothetical protein
VLFSAYHCHLAIGVSDPSPVGPWEPSETQAAFKRMLRTGLANLPEHGDDEESERPKSPEEKILQLERDDPRALDFRNCLRTWFHKAPWSSIRLHEMRQWVYWSIFNAALPPLQDISPSRRVILDEALDLLEKRSGCQLQKGSNPAISPVLLTIDKVTIMWRPLTYYFILCALNLILRVWYVIKWNARFRSHDGLEQVSLFSVLCHF